MGWHVNNGLDRMASFYPAARFHNSLYRPDIVRRLIQMGSLKDAHAAAATALRAASVRSLAASIESPLPESSARPLSTFVPSSRTVGPPLFDCFCILGRSVVRARLLAAGA